MNVEKSLEELEKLSEVVSDENVTLEDSISAFEKSIDIAKDCLKKLSEYKGKLKILQDELGRLDDDDED